MALVTVTLITRFVGIAVARGTGAGVTVMVKVVVAAVKVVVAAWVAVMVAVPTVSAEIVVPERAATAGLLEVKLHAPVDWLVGIVITDLFPAISEIFAIGEIVGAGLTVIDACTVWDWPYLPAGSW